MLFRGLSAKLHSGDLNYNIVGKRKIWYTVSAVIILLAIIGLFVRGLNLSIEFTGGASFAVNTKNPDVAIARDVTLQSGAKEAVVTIIGDERVQVQTEPLDDAEVDAIAQALAQAFDQDVAKVEVKSVGPTWGGEISTKALQALVVFLVLVALFLTFYFEWRMALAAMIALLHDIVAAVGIYALVGFDVSPATVIGFLTILGFSLYDNVVVFDKVKENTAAVMGTSRMTYEEAANLALNQTLVRSINTTVVAVLPVLSILVVGVWILGAGTLKDLALSLFIGMLAGTYSSLFLATPLLCQFKAKQPEVIKLDERVRQRRERQAVSAAGATNSGDGGDSEGAIPGEATVVYESTRRIVETGPRAQPRRKPRSKRK